MKIRELAAVQGVGQKSFYGKARVITYPDGSEALQSYNEVVLRRTPSGELIRTWDGWSATTGRPNPAILK